MQSKEGNIVKLRINASGKRIIGFTELYARDPRTRHPRISDILNSAEPFLLIREEEDSSVDEGRFQAIPKDSLSYVEVLDEPENPSRLCIEGTLRPITVELREPPATLRGQLFVPSQDNWVTVLLDGLRPFINLVNVEFVNSVERYEYLAISKSDVVVAEDVVASKPDSWVVGGFV
jgi:hypothetical protein